MLLHARKPARTNPASLRASTSKPRAGRRGRVHGAPTAVTGSSPIPSSYSLGPEAHAEAGQVAVGDGEEDHEDDVPGVMGEEDGQVVPGLHVAQHEQGDEDDAEEHQHWQEAAVLAGLGEKNGALSSSEVAGTAARAAEEPHRAGEDFMLWGRSRPWRWQHSGAGAAEGCFLNVVDAMPTAVPAGKQQEQLPALFAEQRGGPQPGKRGPKPQSVRLSTQLCFGNGSCWLIPPPQPRQLQGEAAPGCEELLQTNSPNHARETALGGWTQAGQPPPCPLLNTSTRRGELRGDLEGSAPLPGPGSLKQLHPARGPEVLFWAALPFTLFHRRHPARLFA